LREENITTNESYKKEKHKFILEARVTLSPIHIYTMILIGYFVIFFERTINLNLDNIVILIISNKTFR
jgi:nucleoside recognition membrane protein YjiH